MLFQHQVSNKQKVKQEATKWDKVYLEYVYFTVSQVEQLLSHSRYIINSRFSED